MRLSLLDRSRTRVGERESQALTGTVRRAVEAERLGYERFWVAEHHGVPGIASGSPPVLLAAIGARTESIRIGSGGVMLPQHQPLVVAEQFLMLAALHPGRVDLGLGRSLAFTEPVRRALRRPAEAPDTFADDVAELRAHLRGTSAVTAHPVADRPVPLFVLATGRGLELAARLGLPVVVGGPILDERPGDRVGGGALGEALAAYRRDFRPSPDGDAPSVTVSLDVHVAATDAQAREQALPEAWALARSRQTGESGPLEPVADILAGTWTEQVRRRVESSLDTTLAGSPGTVRRGLDALVARTGADELLASTSTYDREALAASDAALRDLVA